ncbi:MAG: riboflavin biosynthesis protein RibD [Gammaproteobacteria bacterium]|nr:MAG: riboflavin biosynthesis protein RibD [Gammaproteobacteria bacterium]
MQNQLQTLSEKATHATLMQRAIELAQYGQHTTPPNPNVGCVIVKDGQIIGEGFHEKAGQEHAEIKALNNAKQNGYSVRGATVYVTLEPCSHDPNPQVSGQGVAKLRQAGIVVTEGVLRGQCDELNLGFFKRMTTGMPWVTVKLGMTLDAKIATAGGESQWITGEKARADVQTLRAKSCAVMTSSATVIADNPSLNVRLDNVVRQPKRVIVDSHLSVSPTAKIFTLGGGVLVYTCNHMNPPPNGRRVHIFVPENNHHADLSAVLKDLGTSQQCNNILVEAGGRFAGALLSQGLVDELVLYTAPLLLGEGAKPAFNFPSVAKLSKAKRFYIHDCSIIGDDSKTIFRKVNDKIR